MKLDQLGFEPTSERRLYVLALKRFEDWPDSIEVDAKHFTLLVAADAQHVASGSIERAAKVSLSSGAVYVCTWGPGCERTHDLFDKVRDDEGEAAIMTTWHQHESLKEALWFFLASTYPDEEFADTTGAAVAVVIDNSGWSSEIARGFKDSHALRIAVVGGDA
jgi:hypothetical protein